MPDSTVSLLPTASECRISEIEKNNSKEKRDISLYNRRKASEASSSPDKMSVVPSHLLFYFSSQGQQKTK